MSDIDPGWAAVVGAIGIVLALFALLYWSACKDTKKGMNDE